MWIKECVAYLSSMQWSNVFQVHDCMQLCVCVCVHWVYLSSGATLYVFRPHFLLLLLLLFFYWWWFQTLFFANRFSICFFFALLFNNILFFILKWSVCSFECCKISKLSMEFFFCTSVCVCVVGVLLLLSISFSFVKKKEKEKWETIVCVSIFLKQCSHIRFVILIRPIRF